MISLFAHTRRTAAGQLSLLYYLVILPLSVLILVEGSLRFFPAAIPLPILLRFNGELRSNIAARLGLPTHQKINKITDPETGVKLSLHLPNTVINKPVDPIDVEYGATNVVTTDKFGFCNSEAVASSDQIKILAVGDSFTWCTALTTEQAWPARLGKLLKVPVYNAGLKGANPKQYAGISGYMLEKINPGLLIIAIYGGNDLRGYSESELKQAKIKPIKVLKKIKNSWLGRNSYAFNTIVGTIDWLKNSDTGGQNSINDIDFTYTAPNNGNIRLNVFNNDVDEVMLARDLLSRKVSPEVWSRDIDTITTLASKYHAQLLIAYIPPAYITYSPVLFQDQNIAHDVMSAHQLQVEYLAKTLRERRVTFVDTTPFLQQTSRSSHQPLYFPGNVHLTERGNEAVATALAPTVRRSLNLP
jgi:GDSL-like Lipase/Acylhydrolase family